MMGENTGDDSIMDLSTGDSIMDLSYVMEDTMRGDSIMDLSYVMEDNMRVDSTMDLDLNQEPLDPPTGSGLGLGSLLSELETAHDQIEDRIRQLEAVTARARQRQRWRQARNHLPETSSETMGSTEVVEQNGVYGDPSTGSGLRVGVGVGSLMNELETTHDRIDNRLRQLQAVTARARQRQRWRQARNHLPETSNVLNQTMGSSEGMEQNGEYAVPLLQGTVERAKSCKRDSSHLVAKALEDTDVKKVVGEGGGFFDCNVCLDMAREPILTCCGHLFCWACFYRLPYVDSTAKECPVCKGEVTDSNVTPIFGNGNDNRVPESESGVKVPPRPQARRIESVRQRHVNRGMSHIPVHIPVAEALRQIRMRIGATGGDRPQQQALDPVTIRSDTTNTDAQLPTSELSSNTMLGGSRRLRSRQFSRVLSETSASLFSISSRSNNPRLFEDYHELSFPDTLLGSIRGQVQPGDGGHPFSSGAAVAQHHHQTMDSTTEINSASTLALSSERTDVSSSNGRVESPRPDAPNEMNLTEPSSSSRRRNRLSRVADVDNGESRALRRRRLNYLL